MNQKSSLIQCYECGRHVNVIKRKHKGMKFCGACYKRTFLHRICPKCHFIRRLYIYDDQAVCIKCERNRPCVRCGKQEYKIGKKTPYGPVCKSCSIYYREPKPCSSCGVLSRSLSRYSKYNVSQPICRKCANTFRGICSSCRKHRDLVESESGLLVCNICDLKGNVKCFHCGSLYPAGYGKQCESCYNLELFKKRKRLNLSSIESQSVRDLFSMYSDWLLNTYKVQKAARVINKHISFFQLIDSQWGCLPTGYKLLDTFAAEGLRHHRMVMRFLSEKEILALSSSAKREHSDLQRILSITKGFKASKEALLVLSHYRNELLEAVQEEKLKLITARFYLTTAKSLLSNGWPTTQDDLQNYLKLAPGQYANIYKFVSYLHLHWGISLIMAETKSKPMVAGSAYAKQKLIRKLKKADLTFPYEDNDIIMLALLYYHGISEMAFKKNGEYFIQHNSDKSISVILGENIYWLPPMPC